MLTPPLLKRLETALRQLEFGSVHLVIHEGKIVRIERNERIRLTDTPEASTKPFGRPTAIPEARHHAVE